MTTAEAIAYYMPQIVEIAAFAKARGLNVDTDLKEIMQGWNRSASFVSNADGDDRDNIMRCLKSVL